MRLAPPAIAIVALVVAGALPTPARANIETEDGGVTSPELPTARGFLRYTETGDLRDLRLDAQAIVGLTTKIELRLTAPLVLHRRVEFADAAGRGNDKALAGLGDVRLRAKVSLFQSDEVMKSTRFAALAELVAPTAEHDRRDGGVEIPRRLQLGTGGWGSGIGAVVTLVRDRHRFSADAWLRHTTRHDGFRAGPTAHLDVAYWFRLHPARFETGEELEVRLVAELLATYRVESRAGERGADDEGFEVWAAPGLQLYVTPSVQLEVNVRIPVVDEIEDDLGHRRLGAGLAVKIRF